MLLGIQKHEEIRHKQWVLSGIVILSDDVDSITPIQNVAPWPVRAHDIGRDIASNLFDITSGTLLSLDYVSDRVQTRCAEDSRHDRYIIRDVVDHCAICTICRCVEANEKRDSHSCQSVLGENWDTGTNTVSFVSAYSSKV